jgi:hypothetical protein
MTIGIEALESLLGKEEPCGTFHDSSLLSVNVDYDKKILSAEFDLCCGDPKGKEPQTRERYRPGRLKIEGLEFWFMEPPTASASQWMACPWVTDDGPLSACPTSAAKALMQKAAGKRFAWYFFLGDLNAFAYVAGDRVSFEWI